MIERGDIRWYTFPRPDKRRPVLVLTRSSAISYLGVLTIAPITTTIRDIPSEVLVTRADGLTRDSAVNLDHLQTVSKGRIGSMIARLAPGKMRKVQAALLFALGFDESPFDTLKNDH